MEMNTEQVEAIVKQVLSSLSATPSGVAAPSKASNGTIPAKARVAMLTELGKMEVKEFPMPEVGDDDLLVKVEGCGICGTDSHEYKRDPFSLIPVALGHEGTGEIVKMGKNVTKDSAGKAVKVGDKIVTIGGIYGKVISLKEDTLVFETGATGNTSTVKISRSAVREVISVKE